MLRAARETQGLTSQDMAVALRIRQQYLEAIESGRYSILPGATYAVGFVRAYAEYLGLDADETVRRLKQETAGG
ncbi:MAG: helix-turn-helix domain-containing protein, partial [Alphaproteobacteria bacterium]|nr:helix-turn-helix domain-containing protein [Alphaproteobacteria bacterium]